MAEEAPLLQNIPVRTVLGEDLRKVFTEPLSLLSGDYSQIEFEILAHLTGSNSDQ